MLTKLSKALMAGRVLKYLLLIVILLHFKPLLSVKPVHKKRFLIFSIRNLFVFFKFIKSTVNRQNPAGVGVPYFLGIYANHNRRSQVF